MKEYNGYSLQDKEIRKRTKFLIVTKGDLDLNGAYGFKTKKELLEFLKEDRSSGGRDRVEAVFKVEAIDV